MKRLLEILDDGSIVLTLRDACIQTTARRAHNGLAENMLSGGPREPGAEGALDLLADFLASTDFARLRSEHVELAYGTGRRVRVFKNTDGTVSWERMVTV